jgi:hypothetical protein
LEKPAAGRYDPIYLRKNPGDPFDKTGSKRDALRGTSYEGRPTQDNLHFAGVGFAMVFLTALSSALSPAAAASQPSQQQQRSTLAVTSRQLSQQIEEAEKALRESEIQRSLLEQRHQEVNDQPDSNVPLPVRIGKLLKEASSLSLAQDILEWRREFQGEGLFEDGRKCRALGEILFRHGANVAGNNDDRGDEDDDEGDYEFVPDERPKVSSEHSGLYHTLYEEEFIPMYQFLEEELLHKFRVTLQQTHYPNPVACTRLVLAASTMENNTDDRKALHILIHTAVWLRGLQELFHRLSQRIYKRRSDPVLDPILLELCRPMVERVRYHFLSHGENDDRPTVVRTDRLPEWLVTFVLEHVLVIHESADSGDGESPYGPWTVVDEVLGPQIYEVFMSVFVTSAASDVGSIPYRTPDSLSVDLANEMIRLVRYVLEEREFFRHTLVAGPSSQPSVLGNAIEQLIRFDRVMKLATSPSGTDIKGSSRLISLVDVFVAGDDELLSWWLVRERESVFATLDDDYKQQLEPDDDTIIVSPRAEVFAALLRSIQAKAGVFSFSGPYLHHVASPLSVHFLDAIHETAKEVRQKTVKSKGAPSSKALRTILRDWMKLINGAHLVTRLLVDVEKERMGPSLSGESDLAQFGRSLERVERVLIEEFTTAFVETILLEKARFAAYLMRCSHTLVAAAATSNVGGDEGDEIPDVSPELEETVRVLATFVFECNSVMSSFPSSTRDTTSGALTTESVACYAPRAMRDSVLESVAMQLLDVALDREGMTPDLRRQGCIVFARDARALLCSPVALSAPPLVNRLLEVLVVMTMPSRHLTQIGDTLCGLAEQPAPLEEEHFTSDLRLYEEASSMIQAKGLVSLELADLLAVLNRRRDLGDQDSPMKTDL